jgi:hypothetical protein
MCDLMLENRVFFDSPCAVQNVVLIANRTANDPARESK